MLGYHQVDHFWVCHYAPEQLAMCWPHISCAAGCMKPPPSSSAHRATMCGWLSTEHKHYNLCSNAVRAIGAAAMAGTWLARWPLTGAALAAAVFSQLMLHQRKVVSAAVAVWASVSSMMCTRLNKSNIITQINQNQSHTTFHTTSQYHSKKIKIMVHTGMIPVNTPHCSVV